MTKYDDVDGDRVKDGQEIDANLKTETEKQREGDKEDKEDMENGCVLSTEVMDIREQKVKKSMPENGAEFTEKTINGAEVANDNTSSPKLLYDVEDMPSIGIIFLYGVQIVITNICFCILTALLIAQLICADHEFTSRLFSTICVIVGLTTMMQTGLGLRAPVFHGPGFSFFMPYALASTDERWGCNVNAPNVTQAATHNMTSDGRLTGEKPWETEWEKIAGSLMAAHAVELFIGLSGIMGLISRAIRPISFGAIFILLAVWTSSVIAEFAKVHWGLAFLSIVLVMLFSMFLNGVCIPVPHWTHSTGLYWTGFPAFALFSVLISVIIVWIFSLILTVVGAFPNAADDIRYQARTDISDENIHSSPIFRVPYPGQFGINFDVTYFLIFLVPVLISTLDTCGGFYQYAAACFLPQPPAHAINRGILVKAVCGLLAASCGMGCSTIAYCSMVGIIHMTKVANRKIYIAGGFLMVLVGLFSKVGAFLISIPKPALAGPAFVGISLLCGSAFANFQSIDFSRTRNQTSIGIAIIGGVFLMDWIRDNPRAINTGSQIGDRIITGMLGIPFLIGGLAVIFLDSALPGPREDTPNTAALDLELDSIPTSIPINSEEARAGALCDPRIRLFDPPFVGKRLRRWRLAKYIPILPYPDLLNK